MSSYFLCFSTVTFVVFPATETSGNSFNMDGCNEYYTKTM